jgi:hypothetical protein
MAGPVLRRRQFGLVGDNNQPEGIPIPMLFDRATLAQADEAESKIGIR